LNQFYDEWDITWRLLSERDGSDNECCSPITLESIKSVSSSKTFLEDLGGTLSVDSKDKFDVVNFEEWSFNL